MPSTLSGIYSAQRGLALNQAAIDIINNNISNMNTPGYSKQRLEISQIVNNSNSTNIIDAAQAGMGAQIDAITRSRDTFLDNSYRKETSDMNYYQEYSNTATQIESVFDELGDNGLTDALNNFYNQLSQLASNPNDYVARNSLVQSATVLTTQFNTVYSQLQDKRTSLVGDYNDPSAIDSSLLNTGFQDVNSQLSQIASLNQQINLAVSRGATPNSLMDQRDTVLDSLSEYMPISVNIEKNNTVTVSLGTTELVRGSERKGYFTVEQGANEDNPAIVQIVNENGSILSKNAYSQMTAGKIGAILQVGGSDTDKLTIKGVIDSLNTLASNFAQALNTIQAGGRYITDAGTLSDNASNPISPSGTGVDPDSVNLFVDSDSSGTITAGNISINSEVATNPYLIAAAGLTSSSAETGDGSNALLMVNVRNQRIAGLGGPTTQGYLTNMIGQLGTQSKSLSDHYDLKDNILQQVERQRDSVTGVSLDEELTDLVRYQRAYEASAKIMTTINEILKTIMNMS